MQGGVIQELFQGGEQLRSAVGEFLPRPDKTQFMDSDVNG